MMGALAVSMIVLADIVLSAGAALILGGAVAIGIALIFIGLQRTIDNRAESALERLNRFGNLPATAIPPSSTNRPAQQPFSFLRNRQRPQSLLETDAEAANRSFNATLARDLARADLRITVGEYTIMTIVLASVGALIGLALPLGGHYLLAIVLLIAGFVVPRYYVNVRKNRRLRAFNSQLADIITTMANSLRSGFALLQAMELIAREGPPPVNQEFERVVREVGFGSSLEIALSHLVERMESDELELMVTAVNVQREVGGNLAQILDTIAATIRDRVQLKGEVRTLTAQQQASGYVIAALPVVLAILLAIINPKYMLGLFTTTTWFGWTLLGCSLVMIGTGFLIIRQIVNIKV